MAPVPPLDAQEQVRRGRKTRVHAKRKAKRVRHRRRSPSRSSSSSSSSSSSGRNRRHKRRHWRRVRVPRNPERTSRYPGAEQHRCQGSSWAGRTHGGGSNYRSPSPWENEPCGHSCPSERRTSPRRDERRTPPRRDQVDRADSRCSSPRRQGDGCPGRQASPSVVYPQPRHRHHLRPRVSPRHEESDAGEAADRYESTRRAAMRERQKKRKSTGRGHSREEYENTPWRRRQMAGGDGEP